MLFSIIIIYIEKRRTRLHVSFSISIKFENLFLVLLIPRQFWFRDQKIAFDGGARKYVDKTELMEQMWKKKHLENISKAIKTFSVE